MFDCQRYFDHAATSPACYKDLEEIGRIYSKAWGNASSIHSVGQEAMHHVEEARKNIANLLGAEDDSQIFFTSGATESANWVINMMPEGTLIGPYEHNAIREPALRRGFGFAKCEEGKFIVPEDCPAFCTLTVCNETGLIYDFPKDFQGIRVADITQAVGKVKINLRDYDFAFWAAHKFGGPQGVGGLYIKDPKKLDRAHSPIIGGSHEGGFRGGTYNVPGIIAMSYALTRAEETREAYLENSKELNCALSTALVQGLAEFGYEAKFAVPRCCNVNWDAPPRVPQILTIFFPRLIGQTLVTELGNKGFAISSGPACSSAEIKPSHTLTALGYSEWDAVSAIRISFGHETRLDSTMELTQTLIDVVKRLTNSG